jgi:lipopolysaccharide transport system ATP-binding protein
MSDTFQPSPRSPMAIRVENLVLEYPLYHHLVLDRFRALIGSVLPALKPPVRRVLDRISFSIEPGELVGIVGQNGAGKTSLLKVISGLVGPTEGSVSRGGRIMALLNMGVGFRATFTGRENLVYGGLLLGLEAREVEDLIPGIAEFSELGDALDQPYFTYSSGMRSRLAFSLATSVPADIVILDETLAAGDARFVTKCYGRLRDIHRSGSTILFISHNLGEVVRLTSRVIVLEQGTLVFDGDVFKGLRVYETILAQQLMARAGIAQRYGDVVAEIKFLNPLGNATTSVKVGQPLSVELVITSERELGETFVVVRILDMMRGQLCSYLMPARWQILGKEGEIGNDNVYVGRGETKVVWEIPHWLPGEGTYSFDVYLGPATDIADLNITKGHFSQSVAQLAVSYENSYMRGAATAMEIPVKKVWLYRDYPAPHAEPASRQ